MVAKQPGSGPSDFSSPKVGELACISGATGAGSAYDGDVPLPDSRDELIAALREEIEGHRKAQAAVYLALGASETDRTKWAEMIEAMRAEVEKLREYATEDMLKIKAMRKLEGQP